MGPRSSRPGPDLVRGNSGIILFLQLHVTKTGIDTANISQKLQTYLNFRRTCMTDKPISQTCDLYDLYINSIGQISQIPIL